MPPNSDLAPDLYCAQDLRRQDHERYLCCLFLPPAERRAAFALYAFYHEVAKTPEIVSEPLLGEIRLQWWREAVEEIYDGTPRRHPVVLALKEAVTRFDLPQSALLALISAREPEVEGDFPTTPEGFKAHVTRTAAPLFDLLLRVCGEERPDLAKQAALAYGVPGILRQAGHYARLPGYDETKLLGRGQCEALAKDAWDALEDARAARGELSRPARKALLPLALAARHLGTLRQANFDYRAERFVAPLANPVLTLLPKAFANRF